jgi:hypothetical protein
MLQNEVKSYAQWKIISITSIEMDFWRVESSGCENTPKIASLNVKAAENPKFSGFHSSFPSRNEFLIKILLQYRCR